jgi:hypothetical protein
LETLAISSPNRAKSADSIDGAIFFIVSVLSVSRQAAGKNFFETVEQNRPPIRLKIRKRFFMISSFFPFFSLSLPTVRSGGRQDNNRGDALRFIIEGSS